MPSEALSSWGVFFFVCWGCRQSTKISFYPVEPPTQQLSLLHHCHCPQDPMGLKLLSPVVNIQGSVMLCVSWETHNIVE